MKSKSATLTFPQTQLYMLLQALILAAALIYAPALFAGTDPCVDPNDNQSREAVCRLVNRERAARGIPPVRLDIGVSRVAFYHARDMNERDYFSHVSPEGLTF